MHLFSFNFIPIQYIMVFWSDLTDEPNTKVERKHGRMGCFCGWCDYIVHFTKIRRIICFALETHSNSIILKKKFFLFIHSSSCTLAGLIRLVWFVCSFSIHFIFDCILCYTSVFIQFEFVHKIKQESFGNIDSGIARWDHQHWRQFNQINFNPDGFEQMIVCAYMPVDKCVVCMKGISQVKFSTVYQNTRRRELWPDINFFFSYHLNNALKIG